MKIKVLTEILLGILCLTLGDIDVPKLADDNLNLNFPEDVAFSVDIEGVKHNLLIERGKVKYLSEGISPKIEIRVSISEFKRFIEDYNCLTWMQKIAYMIHGLGIPDKYVLEGV